jgi:hypothetical protein
MNADNLKSRHGSGENYFQRSNGKIIPRLTTEADDLFAADWNVDLLTSDELLSLSHLELDVMPKRLRKLIRNRVGKASSIRTVKSLAQSFARTAKRQIERLDKEIACYRGELKFCPEVEFRTLTAAEARRRNFNLVPFICLLLLCTGIIYAVNYEWNNAITTALNTAIDFGDDESVRYLKAASFVFVMVFFNPFILKLIDFHLRRGPQTYFRVTMFGIAAIIGMMLLFLWGSLTGTANNITPIPIPGLPAAAGELGESWKMKGLFGLQLALFSIGNYGLTCLAFAAWFKSQDREPVIPIDRQLCLAQISELEGDHSDWLIIFRKSREALKSVRHLANDLYATYLTHVSRLRDERQLWEKQSAAQHSYAVFQWKPPIPTQDGMNGHPRFSQNG